MLGCYICGKEANEIDHNPPKCFFAKGRKSDIKYFQAPICKKDHHMGFGSDHPFYRSGLIDLNLRNCLYSIANLTNKERHNDLKALDNEVNNWCQGVLDSFDPEPELWWLENKTAMQSLITVGMAKWCHAINYENGDDYKQPYFSWRLTPRTWNMGYHLKSIDRNKAFQFQVESGHFFFRVWDAIDIQVLLSDNLILPKTGWLNGAWLRLG